MSKHLLNSLCCIVVIVWMVLFSTLLAGCSNQTPIYELNEKTAVFIPAQPVPTGLLSLRAKDCAVCHPDNYQEWHSSMHSRAFIDPFFSAYHKKDKHDPTCLVCHTPLQNQLEQQVTYTDGDFSRPILTENTAFDPILRDEGVTCAACHVRDGQILGPHSVQSLNAPHPVKYDPVFSSTEICLRCHQVPSKPFSLTRSGVCSTGEEYTGTGWEKTGVVCQDCHMEKIERPMAIGAPVREVRKHTWPGGYSAQQLRKALSFSAERLEKKISVSIKNTGAGHKVPTGDPDRFVVLRFFWEAQAGESIEVKEITFKRQMLWWPIMMDLYDNRLSPGEEYTFSFKPEGEGQLRVKAVYHVMTDWSLQRLKKNHGLVEAPAIERPYLDTTIAISNIVIK